MQNQWLMSLREVLACRMKPMAGGTKRMVSWWYAVGGGWASARKQECIYIGLGDFQPHPTTSPKDASPWCTNPSSAFGPSAPRGFWVPASTQMNYPRCLFHHCLLFNKMWIAYDSLGEQTQATFQIANTFLLMVYGNLINRTGSQMAPQIHDVTKTTNRPTVSTRGGPSPTISLISCQEKRSTHMSHTKQKPQIVVISIQMAGDTIDNKNLQYPKTICEYYIVQWLRYSCHKQHLSMAFPNGLEKFGFALRICAQETQTRGHCSCRGILTCKKEGQYLGRACTSNMFGRFDWSNQYEQIWG